MRKLDTADAELKDILWTLLEEIERDREESVTKKDFLELRNIVGELGQTTRELAEAQKKSERRLDKIEQIVRELAEAQKRTEQELRELVREHKELVRENFK